MRRSVVVVGALAGLALAGSVAVAGEVRGARVPARLMETREATAVLDRVGETAHPSRGGPSFEVGIAAGVAEQALATVGRSGRSLDGRVYVIVTPDGSSEPRLQVLPLLPPAVPPFWGRDTDGLKPGRTVTLAAGDGRVFGYPLASMADLQPGTYHVQAFMNVYETFRRADGSVVKLHLPCGDGNVVFRGTGNVMSKPVTIEVRRHHTPRVRLQLTDVVPPAEPVPAGGTCQQGNPPESAHVRQVKIRSERLSAFWGRPIYIAASVLLPEGYDADPARRYPVVYQHGHYPTAYNPVGNPNPFGFLEDGSNAFSRFWLAPDSPRVIAVTFRHENPFYDASYTVDSPNVGPYGAAFTTELMPEIDRRFRTVGEGWARTTTGYSTGGWQALAQLALYPDLYSGTFSMCPDVVDFRSMYGVTDLYADPNLYFKQYEFNRVPRPHFRSPNGSVELVNDDWNHYELALGNRSRSGQYMDMYNATWGPQGADGYPAEAWDKLTGQIDHAVAEQWRPYDLRQHIVEHWATLAPKLAGGIHVYIGDDDGYYLDGAVHRLQDALAALDPPADADIQYAPDTGHCWVPFDNAELVRRMAAFMAERAPAAAASAPIALGREQ